MTSETSTPTANEEHPSAGAALDSAAGDASRRYRGQFLVRTVGMPIAVFAAFMVFLTFVESSTLARTTALMLFWVLISMGWNFIGGFGGQVFLGNAAFVGLGAFTSVLAYRNYGVSPWLGFLLAGAVCAVLSLIAGLPTLRLRGVYFTLSTVALPLVLVPVANWLGHREVLIPLSRNELASMQFRDLRWYAVILATLILLTWFGTVALMRSRWFAQLRAVSQDEDAARSVGVSAYRLKLAMFVLCGVISGMAGVVYAQLLFVITPSTVFGLTLVIGTLTICILGGIGYAGGPIIGAALVVPLTEYLDSNFSHIAGASNLAFGLILIGVILVLPNGILGSGIARKILGRQRLAPDVSPQEVSGAAEMAVGGVSRLLALHRTESSGLEVDSTLSIQSATKRYGAVVAVDDISIDVETGEFLGVVGPNGAGKTTLFDLVTGYQSVSEGAVQLDGADISSWSADRRSRLGMRRTFQLPRPLPDLSVFENVWVGTLQGSRSKADRRSDAMIALSIVDLLDHVNLPAGSLGPSQTRRLELARSLAGRPRILLLDEPLAGLDPDEKAAFVSILRECSASGLTILLVDHDIRTVASAVQRMVVLDNGSVIASGAPQAVLESPAVIDAYLGGGWSDATN